MRIGMGYDVHKLVEGRPMIIGGSDNHMWPPDPPGNVRVTILSIFNTI